MEFFERILELANQFVCGSADLLWTMLTGAHPVLVVLALLLVSGWLGAACWASGLAEAAEQSPFRHFALGLVVPFYYPFQLKAKYPAAASSAAPTTAGDAPAAAPGAGSAAVSAPPAPPAPTLAVADGSLEITLDASGFRQLQRAGLVTPEKPWLITYGAGTVRVSRILDAMDACAVVEVITANSGQSSRLRIPYDQIKSLTPTEDN